MGIPDLFRHFSRRCPGAIRILEEGDVAGCRRANVAELHVDFNGVVHECARDTERDPEESFEARVVQGSMEHVARLAAMLGAGLVLVAVDGVPPRAKMVQQRSRRFMKHYVPMDDDHGALSLMASDPGRERSLPDPGPWDSNVITPGTPFMARLDEALYGRLEGIVKERCPGVTRVVVSGSDEPGEGEQKIFSRLDRGRDGVSKMAVCGLDADLLLMALSHPSARRILVVRESDSSKEKIMLQTIDAWSLAKHASGEVAGARGFPSSSNASDADVLDRCREYVALMCLLGNDFVPSLPGIRIRDNGIDIVLRAYGRAFSSCSRASDGEARHLHRGGPPCIGGMDPIVLSSITRELAEVEAAGLEAQERRVAEKRSQPVTLFLSDPRYHAGWRPRYYSEIFYGFPRRRTASKDVRSVCVEYLAALAWSAAYLGRQECLSRGYYYPYPHSPTSYDVSHTVFRIDPRHSGLETKYPDADRDHLAGERELGSEVDWQLLMVLPLRTILLHAPEVVRRYATDPGLGYAFMFPDRFRVVTYNRTRFHESLFSIVNRS
jgi:5'-3' exonuclease